MPHISQTAFTNLLIGQKLGFMLLDKKQRLGGNCVSGTNENATCRIGLDNRVDRFHCLFGFGRKGIIKEHVRFDEVLAEF